MPKLFVVAPHSHCDSKNPVRHCDRVALAAVQEICAYDAVHSGKECIVDRLTADTLRTMQHDYNRPNTDAAAWREDLRARVKRAKPDFVLEIHSFPGNHEMYQRLWHNADLAIFASDHNKPFIDSLVAKIKSRIPTEYRIEVVAPWHAVAITDDMVAIRATDPGCKQLMHSLFEFNEDMPRERIPVLTRAIYSATLELVGQNGVHGGNASGFDAAITHPASFRLANVSTGAIVMLGLAGTLIALMLLTIASFGWKLTTYILVPPLRSRVAARPGRAMRIDAKHPGFQLI
jgi:hypothetical protein